MAVREVEIRYFLNEMRLSRGSTRSGESIAEERGIENIPLGSLAHLKQATVGFKDDRPTLRDIHYLLPKRTIELLFQEVKEFNGSDEEGIFADEALLSDYRRQEVADILIFLMDLLDEASQEPGTILIPDGELVQRRAEILAEELEIGIITPTQDSGYPLPPEKVDEVKMKDLKHRLNMAAESINPENYHQWQARSRESKLEVIYELLSICYVISYLLGVNPIRSALEKVARNMLLYKKDYLQLGYNDIVSNPNLSDEEKIEQIEVRYSDARKKCKEEFEGDSQAGTRYFYFPNGLPIVVLEEIVRKESQDGELQVDPSQTELVRIF